MSLFPLYDKVVSEMDNTDTFLNKNQCSTITQLDQNHQNIIYLIILHHYIKTNKSNIPYGGKTVSNGKGISFRRLSQIPKDVQKIIHRYLTIISSN